MWWVVINRWMKNRWTLGWDAPDKFHCKTQFMGDHDIKSDQRFKSTSHVKLIFLHDLSPLNNTKIYFWICTNIAKVDVGMRMGLLASMITYPSLSPTRNGILKGKIRICFFVYVRCFKPNVLCNIFNW